MDQCCHCVVRGDMEACMNTECFQRENWFIIETLKELQSAREKITELEAQLEVFCERVVGVFEDNKNPCPRCSDFQLHDTSKHYCSFCGRRL